MDQITHDIRHDNWVRIIAKFQERLGVTQKNEK